MAGCSCTALQGAQSRKCSTRVGLTFGDLFPPRPLGERLPRLRRPFPAADVLQAVAYEALVVYLCARSLDEGKRLTGPERERLRLAVSRLQHAAEVARDG